MGYHVQVYLNSFGFTTIIAKDWPTNAHKPIS